MKQILFFGNSLTAGYGLPTSATYPALIQKKLHDLGYEYVCLNAGVNGETSAGGKYRIDSWLKKPFDIFVLELGANDGLRGIPTRETTLNLQEIIHKVKKQKPEVKIIMAGMEIPEIVPGRYAAEFRKLFRELAEENNLEFIPFILAGVVGNKALNLADGIHPNAAGHEVLAKHVWNVLKDLL